MTLKDPTLSSSPQLRAASSNKPPLRRGARGHGVMLLQGALMDLGYAFPISTRKTGKPDGIYGKETRDNVEQFQGDSNGLTEDGVAGANTLAALDKKLIAKAKGAKPPAKLPSNSPTTPPEYRVGTGDPKVPVDPEQPHGKAPKTFRGRFIHKLLKDEVSHNGGAVRVALGFDAALSLRHYLHNTGVPFEVKFEKLLADSPYAQQEYSKEIHQAKLFVEQLAPGVHHITATRSSISKAYESHNWALTVGGFQAWGKGRAHVTDGSAGRVCALDFEYRFKDRYNYDGGKGWGLVSVPTSIPPFDIPFMEGEVTVRGGELEVRDELLKRLHEEGLARSFITHGVVRKRLRWRQGFPIPWEQYRPTG